jgi:hypothetical protein
MLPRAVGEQHARTGRPSLYKAEYCEIVESLGRQGKSKAQMCAVLNIGRQTFADWEGKHSAFRESVARAMEHSQAWWEAKAQSSLDHKHFQAQLWRYSMAGRFKDDYAEARQTGQGEIALDLLKAVDEIADRRAKQLSQAPGDSAKPVAPLDVVTSDTRFTPKKA